jgi:hypothetical protein
MFRPALKPSEASVQRVLGDVSLEVEWQGREADHLPISSAEIKNSGAIPPPLICLHGEVPD